MNFFVKGEPNFEFWVDFLPLFSREFLDFKFLLVVFRKVSDGELDRLDDSKGPRPMGVQVLHDHIVEQLNLDEVCVSSSGDWNKVQEFIQSLGRDPSSLDTSEGEQPRIVPSIDNSSN